jgi:hypothetical protein
MAFTAQCAASFAKKREALYDAYSVSSQDRRTCSFLQPTPGEIAIGHTLNTDARSLIAEVTRWVDVRHQQVNKYYRPRAASGAAESGRSM